MLIVLISTSYYYYLHRIVLAESDDSDALPPVPRGILGCRDPIAAALQLRASVLKSARGSRDDSPHDYSFDSPLDSSYEMYVLARRAQRKDGSEMRGSSSRGVYPEVNHVGGHVAHYARLLHCLNALKHRNGRL